MSKEVFRMPVGDEKDVQGEGFVLKGASSKEGSSPLHNAARVEFRPGESTDVVKERQAREPKEGDQKDKYEFDKEKSVAENVRFAAEHFAVMLKNQSEYSEALIVNPNGRIEKQRRVSDSAPPYFAGQIETPADLYELMKKVQDAHPEFKVLFENDPGGRWVKYKVTKLQ